MALSDKAQRALEVGMADKELAQEVADKAASPAALSEKAQDHLEVGLASSALKDEVAAAVAAGSTALSDKAKAAIKIMMANNADGQELIDEIES